MTVDRRGGRPPSIRPPGNKRALIVFAIFLALLAVAYWHDFFATIFTGKP